MEVFPPLLHRHHLRQRVALLKSKVTRIACKKRKWLRLHNIHLLHIPQLEKISQVMQNAFINVKSNWPEIISKISSF